MLVHESNHVDGVLRRKEFVVQQEEKAFAFQRLFGADPQDKVEPVLHAVHVDVVLDFGGEHGKQDLDRCGILVVMLLWESFQGLDVVGPE